jgi:hypothetical protein
MSLSWDANSSSHSQQFPHPRSDKSSSHPAFHSFRIHLVTIFPSTPKPPKLFVPSGSPTKPLYAFFTPPPQCHMPRPSILLDFITLTIFGEKCRSWSSLLRNFFQYPLTFSLLDPYIFNSVPSNTVNLYFPNLRDKFHIHIKQQQMVMMNLIRFWTTSKALQRMTSICSARIDCCHYGNHMLLA